MSQELIRIPVIAQIKSPLLPHYYVAAFTPDEASGILSQDPSVSSKILSEKILSQGLCKALRDKPHVARAIEDIKAAALKDDVLVQAEPFFIIIDEDHCTITASNWSW